MGSGASSDAAASTDDVSIEDAHKALQLFGYLRSVHEGCTMVSWVDVDEACSVLGLGAFDVQKLPRARGGVNMEAFATWSAANSVSGLASDSEGLLLHDVVVSCGGFRIVTGDDGRFNVPKGCSVSLSKPGFAPAFYPAGSGPILAVLRRGAVPQFSNKDGAVVEDAVTGTKLYVLPGSLAKADGSIFEGEAAVTLTVIDATKDEDLAAMPGNFRGRSVHGEEVQLATFGAVHVLIVDAETGEDLMVAEGKGLTLSLPSSAAYDLEVLYEAPSAWFFDGAKGMWVQEEGTSIMADGQQLPPSGHKLMDDGPLRVAGSTCQDTEKMPHRVAKLPLSPPDGVITSVPFWHSDGTSFEWSLNGEKGMGEDCGSGPSGKACLWLAVARLCELQSGHSVCPDALLKEAQIRALSALPSATTRAKMVLRDVLDTGPVSLEALKLLDLPILASVSLRALEVHDMHVVRTHRIDGAKAPSDGGSSAALLLESCATRDHAMLLHLPEGLQSSAAFRAIEQSLAGHASSSGASGWPRWGGKKGGKKGKAGRIAVEDVVAGTLRHDDFESFSKKDLLKLLKDKRLLTLTLKKVGWWNIDAPLPDLAVLTGKALDSEGLPICGEQVVAKALSYSGWSYAVTGTGGSFKFVLPQSGGSMFRVEVCRCIAGECEKPAVSSRVAWSRLHDKCSHAIFGTHEKWNELGNLKAAHTREVEVKQRAIDDSEG